MKSRNFRAELIRVVSVEVADTEFAVPHNLGTVPADAIVVGRGANAALYKGTTPWTASNIYLKAPNTRREFLLFLFT